MDVRTLVADGTRSKTFEPRAAACEGMTDMNASTKANVLQSYQLVVYKRALHPELFQVKARKSMRVGSDEVECWLMPGSHLMRFQVGTFCVTELVTDQEDGLPTTGAVANFPCAGEKDFEHVFAETGVNYVTTVQTETLSEQLYATTYREIVDLANETDGLMYKWTQPDGGKCLSVLDVERYHPSEVHVQSYHLIAQGGIVLRTQTIFERV